LLAPSRPDQAGTVTVEFLRELYAALRVRHDYVIVDTPPGFSPEVIASIDLASHLLVVGMLDALSLKDTKLGLETLDLMGSDPKRIRLVLNRADSSVGIKRSEAEAILGRTPDVFVPSDREIPRATTDGQPIVVANGRSDAARAFHALADLYEHGDSSGTGNGSAPPKQRLRVLARLARS
jgi:pilus assembly protein CpaE